MKPEHPSDPTAQPQPGDELRQTRRELARVTAQLERLQQRKASLLAMASHDLRTPLAVIQGYSQLLESGLTADSDPALREYITTIVAHTAVLRNTIENLVALDAMERGELHVSPARCDLNELAGGALAQIEGLATIKELTLHVVVAPEPVWVFADETEVGRVLYSLLSHGEKYARPGGELWVEVASDGVFGCVSVRDPHRRLPDDRVKGLFDLVELGGDGQGLQGTDMGLVVARHVAEAHGGRVASACLPEAGVVLTLCLPCCDENGDE